MKKLIKHSLRLCAVAGVCSGSSAFAMEAATAPVGYNTVTCLPNSDTIVSVPFLDTEDSFNAAVNGSATAVADNPATTEVDESTQAFFDIDGIDLGATSYANLYYVRFTSGSLNGNVYQIITNDTDTLTVDLSGDPAGMVSDNDTFRVYKFWTLGTLFPQATQTTVVESSGTSSIQRRTSILLPDQTGVGINLAPVDTFFLLSEGWRKVGDGSNPADDTLLWPDTYFIVRHPASVSSSTTYTPMGTVDTLAQMTIPLTTRTDGRQDNFIAIPRPVDVELQNLNLLANGAFVTSIGTSNIGRRDQLLVFDNDDTSLNKAPLATYFHDGTNWRRAGHPDPVDSEPLKASHGLVIRKHQTVDGATSFWVNTPSY